MSVSTGTKPTLSHEQFAKLVLRIMPFKEDLQKKIDSGANVSVLAKEYGVSPNPMRNALRTIGVEFGRKHAAKLGRHGTEVRLDALEEAVRFLAENLGVTLL